MKGIIQEFISLMLFSYGLYIVMVSRMRVHMCGMELSEDTGEQGLHIKEGKPVVIA